MPIYEYRCPHCQHTFEEWVKLSDMHGQEPCPDCGTPSPRVMSHTSFVLKGGGWYVSDYGYRKGVKEEDASSGAKEDAAAKDAAASGETTGSGGTSAGEKGGGKSAKGAKASSSTPSTSTGASTTAPAA